MAILRTGEGPSIKHVLFKRLIAESAVQAYSRAWPSAAKTEISIGTPKPEFGEYSIATFPFAKALKQAPPSIASSLAGALQEDQRIGRYFDVSVVGGYVNFKFSNGFLTWGITNIGPEFGQNKALEGQKIQVEFVSANPTGPLHIGHARWAVLGDDISRLLSACGAQVEKEFYINDTGAQIDRFLGSIDAAKKGVPIPENGYHGGYIHELAKQEGNPVLLMIAHQRRTLESAGVHFDNWFSEKTLHERNELERAVKILTEKGLTYRALGVETEEDGPNIERGPAEEGEALWFRSRQFGDDKDRVIMRADGRPTYFAADIAYHLNKVERGYDHLINILGADHGGYVARISAAIQGLSDGKQSHQIIIGQLVKLLREGKEVKMSKRSGTAIMFHDLLEEIGADAIRAFMAFNGFDTPVNIDLELASDQRNNPVFYVQYAHARISQLLQRAEQSGLYPAWAIPDTYVLNDGERSLLAPLFKFPDEVFLSAQARSPHLLFRYAIEIATNFHAFYNQYKVVDETQPEITEFKLAMMKASRWVFKNALGLLGISAPQEMRRGEED